MLRSLVLFDRFLGYLQGMFTGMCVGQAVTLQIRGEPDAWGAWCLVVFAVGWDLWHYNKNKKD